MIKKLICFMLCIVLGLGVFAGCTVFELDTEADLKREVAVIAEREFSKKVLKERFASLTQQKLDEIIVAENLTDDELYDTVIVFKSDEKRITKYRLLETFNSNAEDYIQNQGMTIEQAIDQSLETLINRELLLDEIHYLMEAGELEKPTQTQINNIWKSAYSQIDNEIYNQMEQIAKDFKEDPPTRPQTGTDPEVQYAVKTVEERPEDLHLDGEHVWTPFDYAVTIPRKGEHLKLEGVRKFMTSVFKVMDSREYLLTQNQKDKLSADKEKWKKYATANPDDLVDVYPDLMNYFSIQYFFYDSQFDSLLIANLEKMIKDRESVTNEEVKASYDELLLSQKYSYDYSVEDYKTALDDTSQTIIYHPNSATSVKQYYVKHILIPFSDEQKAMFAANGKTSDSELKRIRNSLVSQITSYEHRNGFDYVEGGLKSIIDIENEIYSKMASKKGFSYEAEQTFEELIFKYNTDPGGFNNALGYGLRYGEASSFMKEFEEGANLLYERYLEEGNNAIGSLTTAITDYGVHVMMLSSVVRPGRLSIMDFTDVMRTQTVFEKIQKQLLTTKQDNAYTKYQNEVIKILKSQRSSDINTDEKLMEQIKKEILKQVSG